MNLPLPCINSHEVKAYQCCHLASVVWTLCSTTSTSDCKDQRICHVLYLSLSIYLSLSLHPILTRLKIFSQYRLLYLSFWFQRITLQNILPLSGFLLKVYQMNRSVSQVEGRKSRVSKFCTERPNVFKSSYWTCLMSLLRCPERWSGSQSSGQFF